MMRRGERAMGKPAKDADLFSLLGQQGVDFWACQIPVVGNQRWAVDGNGRDESAQSDGRRILIEGARFLMSA